MIHFNLEFKILAGESTREQKFNCSRISCEIHIRWQMSGPFSVEVN